MTDRSSFVSTDSSSVRAKDRISVYAIEDMLHDKGVHEALISQTLYFRWDVEVGEDLAIHVPCLFSDTVTLGMGAWGPKEGCGKNLP